MPFKTVFRSHVLLFCFLACAPSLGLAQSTVNLILVDASMDEELQGTGSFSVIRDGSTAASMNVFVELTGSAQYTKDFTWQNLSGYAHPTWYVITPAGQNSTTVTLMPVRDFVIEGDESLIFTLLPSKPGNVDYLIGAQTTAMMTILDLVNDIFSDGFEDSPP